MFQVITKPAPADDAVRYRYTTVRAIRGTEARTIAKWRQDGWELDSQSQGMLRTEITFRRPKPDVPWRLLALAGGLVLLVAVVVTGVVLVVNGGGGASDSVASPTETVAAPSGQSATESSSAPAPATPQVEAAPTQPAVEEILTAANNPEVAALLTVSDPNDPLVAAFAAANQGRIIEFDAHIVDATNYGGYATRFDFLIGAGDYTGSLLAGPNFTFEDVNVTLDLNLTGAEIPDYIGTGTNLHIVAEVVEYNPTQQLFYLEPVATQVR